MNEVIANKIESIRRCVTRIESTCPATTEMLMEDVDAQDILSINLERAVQLAVDMATYVLARCEIAAPDTMADAFRRLHDVGMLDSAIAEKMMKAVGFRNIAVHAYREMDWNIVHAIARQAPSDLREFIRQISNATPRSQGDREARAQGAAVTGRASKE